MTRFVGLYGGSFDPIHRGHVEPVEEARRNLGLHEVIYVPAFVPPHKPDGAVASSHHRFAMAALALEPHAHLLLDDYELRRSGTTYSVDTLAHFRGVVEGELVLVIGSDTLATLPTWRAWREIVSSTKLAVLYREPYDLARLRSELPDEIASRLAPEGARPADGGVGSVFWGGNAPVTISATWIRRALLEGNDLANTLPSGVESYLRKHALYLGRPPVPRLSEPSTT